MKIKLVVLFVLSSQLLHGQNYSFPMLNQVMIYKGNHVINWDYHDANYWDEKEQSICVGKIFSLRASGYDSLWILNPARTFEKTDSVVLKIADDVTGKFRFKNFEMIFIPFEGEPVTVQNTGNAFNNESLKAMNNFKPGDYIVLRKVFVSDNKLGIIKQLNSVIMKF